MNATEKKYVTKRIEDEAKKHRENICGEGKPFEMPEVEMWALGFSGAVPEKPKFQQFLDTEPKYKTYRYHDRPQWENYRVHGPDSIWDFSAFEAEYQETNKAAKAMQDSRVEALDKEVQSVLDQLMLGSSDLAMEILTEFIATDF
jgi:hypothetical protein